MMRERRDLARQRVEAYHKERKLQAIASHEDEKKKCKDILERKEKELIKDIYPVKFPNLKLLSFKNNKIRSVEPLSRILMPFLV